MYKIALPSRRVQEAICSLCKAYRSAYFMVCRNSNSQTLLSNKKYVDKTIGTEETVLKKSDAASEIKSPSILALKIAGRENKIRTSLSSESDKSSITELKSRLTDLLEEWDDGDSLPHSITDEAFQHDFYIDRDRAVESIILPSDFVRATKPSPILGTEDREIPPSNVPCVGCGALLQCQHKTFPGFLPSEYFKILSEKEMKTSICQRCYYIRHCGAFKEVTTDLKDYETMVSKIRHTKSIVVVVVDVMDMGGSIVPNLTKLIGNNHPLIVVGNKADLLSPDCQGYLSHVRDILKSTCYSAGLSNIRKVTLTSAKTGFGIERLINMLFAFYKREVDVYIVGTANTGKSSLFNALLASDYCKSSARNLIERATVSVWPGTTLSLLKFPIMRPSHRVHALRQVRLKQEEAQKKMQKQLERTRKKVKPAKSWELKEDVRVTDTRKPFTMDHDEKGEPWGQTIASYYRKADGSLEYENSPTVPETYDADLYDESYWTFDTPGVINPDQVLNFLTTKEMSFLTPVSMIEPRCLLLKPQETLFVSGLCRLDLKESDSSVFLAVHSGPDIPIHVVPTDEADQFYESHIGTDVFGVPIGDKERLSKLPSLVAKTISVVGDGEKVAVADIQLSSVGWVSVALKKGMVGTFQIFTPGRKGTYLRQPALMPLYLQFKGKRMGSSAFYRTKPPGRVMAK